MAELTPEQEAALAAYIGGMYATWLPVVEGAVLAGTVRFGLPPDPAAINTTAAVWRAEVERLEATQLQPLAERAYTEENPTGDLTATTPVMAAAATGTLLFLMAKVAELQAVLATAVATAATVAAAVAAIKEILDPTSPRWRAKSNQVAQTEGDRWVQAATLQAAFDLQRSTGRRYEKEWVSRDDDRVRFTHQVADGQKRPVNVPFIVGGVEMMYPKDPSAPPQEVVSCRCGMRIRPMEAGRRG